MTLALQIVLAIDFVLAVCLIITMCSTGKKTIKEKKEKIKSVEIAPEIEESKTALILEDIVKVYVSGENKVNALKGVNLAFRKNEFVSILGPSGCGKTTMLNIIGGLDRYTAGDLKINGVSTKEYKDGDWDTYRNNSIGFVFQSYNLITHQSVLHNVELALTLSGVSKHERKKRALAVLERVGLKGLENKKPNQLSGGQMQRVAIARALVNDPEIILADEPTGALDTETSIQIMELLKEVAKDRLVIMVTHNPELAINYSTRIIKLIDGLVKDDSNPCKIKEELKPKKEKKKNKSQMKLSTAFSLSMSNLRTKKGRTILTSIAGSIGIIGIALVLALSTGFSGYINKLQGNTLSVYPITVSEAVIDISDFEKLSEDLELEKFPKVKEIYTQQMFTNLANMIKSNKITEEYVDFVNKFVLEENEKVKDTDTKWKYSVTKDYGFNIENFIYSEIGVNLAQSGTPTTQVMAVDTLSQTLENMFNQGMKDSGLNMSASFVKDYIPTLTEMPNNYHLLNSQYDLLEGEWADSKEEVMLVLNEQNQLSDITLAFLGFRTIDGMDASTYTVTFGGKDTFTFSEAMEKEFYFIPTDSKYTKLPTGDYIQNIFQVGAVPSDAVTLKIKGIVRLKEGVTQGVLNTGVAYTSALTEAIVSDGLSSNMKAELGDGQAMVISPINRTATAETQRSLGMSRQVNKLSIYSIGYEEKEQLKNHLTTWNQVEGMQEEDKVHFSDATEMLFSALNTVVDAVKIVLICFTAISLIVSSIMIGIITYVSVVERTKEIGILRSLGARKKDISRIFNAETFIIGLFSGLIGIGITYLLCIPINIIINLLIQNAGTIAMLNIIDAIILVVVSFGLTLIAGLIPSRIAAKKDPVVALRTE